MIHQDALISRIVIQLGKDKKKWEQIKIYSLGRTATHPPDKTKQVFFFTAYSQKFYVKTKWADTHPPKTIYFQFCSPDISRPFFL